MSIDENSLEERLSRIEAMQQELLAGLAGLENQIDVLSQECHRSATVTNRISLVQEGAKSAAANHQKALVEIQAALFGITALLGPVEK